MKYVKTFENFNYDTTNENWLWGEGNIWSKIGSWWSNWKNKKVAEGVKKFEEFAKQNPEKIEEMQRKVQPELADLSEDEIQEAKEKLSKLQVGELPAELQEAGEEFIATNEMLKSTSKYSKVYESKRLLLESKELSFGQTILKYLGLGAQWLGILSMILSLLAIFIIGGSFAGVLVFFGMVLGGFLLMVMGGTIEMKADPDDPKFRKGGSTGWESSGGPIM